MRYDLGTTMVPLSGLTTHPANARHGDVDAIATSLRANGQFRPIVVARGVILAGNHAFLAAQKIGWTEIAVVSLDIDPEGPDARRIMLADNKTAELGGYDDRALLDLLESLNGDPVGTGYLDHEIAALRELLTLPTDEEWSDLLEDVAGGEEGEFTRVTLSMRQADKQTLMTAVEAITGKARATALEQGAAVARLASEFLGVAADA